MITIKEIILLKPRGFCAGVHRAIDTVEACIDTYGLPLYVKHEIVHNKYVVSYFQNKGIKFIENISEAPANSTIIFSAHGVSPQVVLEAQNKNLQIIDATCPLVNKVHLEARKYKKSNTTILLIGHKNHIETIGTYGEAPESTIIIENIHDAKNIQIPPNTPLAYLTQTTLSVDDTKEIIEVLKQKFPHIQAPRKEDICYATTNRQEAIKKIAHKLDILFVLGNSNSSNSSRLYELGLKNNIPSYLLTSTDNWNMDWITPSMRKIGITAGASTPEYLVENLVKKLQQEYNIEKLSEFILRQETASFNLPKVLQNV